MKTFDHIGIPTDIPRLGERFVEQTRVWVTDPHLHPFSVEWLRYEADSAAPEQLRRAPHVAYRVDDIGAECAGLTELLPPFASVAGHVVGFYEADDGAIVELMQF